MTNNAIVLLSGGLDSLVTLDYACKSAIYNPQLVITFDYGQKARVKEIESSERIANYYGIKHEIITLDWLKNITKTSLVADDLVPTSNLMTKESALQVWVPNRNALFLNIAASFADAYNYKYILYGANRDEAENFSDNTELFRNKITNLFLTSTLVKPKVIAPLINYSKDDIVRDAIRDSMPLDLIWSCYLTGDRHCGECESCIHLKEALIANHGYDFIGKFF